ncbi:unnamed protein product [Arabis nemorensis]|uniref:FKB95-like N-terminal Kelch domain-containing protein n=1 Tax=Arabis nemorensis TaxID=586526 RepID=A0A565B7Q1_9BRAS|nr:unnamed protein product [Arabis nemorensis]
MRSPRTPISGRRSIGVSMLLGGYVNGLRTSAVFLLDCRSHKWHQVTSMTVPRASPAASVVDGKIYVFGGFRYDKTKNWGEVFDPKTQTWDVLPVLEDEDPTTSYIQCLIHHSVVVEDKVYLVDACNRTLFYYLPSQCKWGRRNHLSPKTAKRDWCVIDNLLYSFCHNGRIYWCEREQLDRRDDGLDNGGRFSIATSAGRIL